MLQSSNVVQLPHRPSLQTMPLPQSSPVRHPPQRAPNVGFTMGTQAAVSQSAGVVHWHAPARHVPAGPHRGSDSPLQCEQMPSAQTRPMSQSAFVAHSGGAHSPFAQTSPAAQSELFVHSHSDVVCVKTQRAAGPHSLADEQEPHLPSMQTFPGGQALFSVHA